MGGTHCGKNGWNWCIDNMKKMGGAHSCKNGGSSLLQKWVELIMAKMGGTSVIDTVAKMG